uniref:Apolipoprotein D n=1 Tax=Anopheles christyi TaxID=43041 RepID=A0A182JQH2_9DIPT
MNSIQFLAAAFVLGLVGLTSGQLVSPGTCPDYPVHLNFDVQRYLGLWYEISRYDQVFQRGGECVTAEYSLNADGSVRVFNSMRVPPSQARQSDTGRAVVAFPDAIPLEAKLNVTFDATALDVSANYWVLGTDYENYAVVWGCFGVATTLRAENAWILSREPELSEQAAIEVQDYINRFLSKDDLIETNQNLDFCCAIDPDVTAYPQCPLVQSANKKPAISMHSCALSTVLMLAGLVACVAGLLTDEACPQDVSAMKDFSLNDYAGRWYEIKRYEQFYEKDLDCVVAEYQKTGDNSISVKNGAFRLDNDTRVVADGTAVVSFPDDTTRPAKLSVAFFGAKPDRSNYWVLDTDYTSFAVVWSCEPFFRDASKNVLGFWIFSRNPTFPTDEAVVKRVDELVKKYADASKFEVPNQSDERYMVKMLKQLVCFALLATLAQGTIFERPCRTDVAVVQDFQVDKYLGLWYDLEHYEASFEQNTDCVTAEYSRYGDGSIRVFNSAVRLTDGLLYAVDGLALLSYPEAEILEAKLNVSFYGAPNDESNYWVLDTDYENYSIVWSCEPIGEERSLEYYWLLSRTPSLPDDEELKEKIEMLKEQNGIIDDELIITEHFAEGKIVHIFALGVLISNLLVEGFVVKDGNCTLATANIPFVKDFQLEKYLGKWYELERYEQDYERNMECVSIVYRWRQPIETLEVNYRGYLPYNGTVNTFTGSGGFTQEPAQENTNSSTTTIAKLLVSFGRAYNATNYWVVDTDYVNYAIVYSCVTFAEMSQAVEGYWLLARTPNLPDNPQVIERVKYLRSTYFQVSHIRFTNHTEELCPAEEKLPTEPSLVVLPPLLFVVLVTVGSIVLGQRIVSQPCPDPTSRPVVQYFDLQRYVDGRWYEISRYDQHFEKDCDCGYATYTPQADGSVRVQNCCERLPNTTVKCSIGKAVVSFPDEFPLEGRFNVTFGGPPRNSNYWILDTDYDNYALIYYCKNLSESKSAEAAWVLSKQRTIHPSVQDVVNNLVDKYFVRQDMRVTEQSQAKCKYDTNDV